MVKSTNHKDIPIDVYLGVAIPSLVHVGNPDSHDASLFLSRVDLEAPIRCFLSNDRAPSSDYDVIGLGDSAN